LLLVAALEIGRASLAFGFKLAQPMGRKTDNLARQRDVGKICRSLIEYDFVFCKGNLYGLVDGLPVSRLSAGMT